MNILITGAAGFIASHLIETLIMQKHTNIIGIDNFYSGTTDNLAYIESIDLNNVFTFLECDIRDFSKLNNIIQTYNITHIYHLAAIVSVQDSIEKPHFTHDVNVTGTINILEASRKNGVKKVIFSSSAAVYGDEPSLPKNELSPTKPISPYGYQKLIGEQYMKLYNDLYNIETVCLRYFNVYGRRQSASSDYSGVISIFESKIKKNQVANVYGDGKQYRDFVHVSDIALVNSKAMLTNGIGGEIFCVGTANKTSINDLIKNLQDKYHTDFLVQYLPSRDGDILESICDNNKIKKNLDIIEFKAFKDGILNAL